MKGLELAQRCFEDVGRDYFARQYPDLFPRMAFGLSGEGSECLGFDDEISRDHDWGADFCVWLPEDIFAASGEALQEAYAGMPCGDYPRRKVSRYGDGRVGVLSIPRFYRGLLGTAEPPEDALGWLRIPEAGLAAATSGRVFLDGPGQFTAVRNSFLAYYPEDVRRKKLAAKAAKAARAGQYNYSRCLRRDEIVPAQIAKADFCVQAMGMVFLLNRVYAPYFKWMHRALRDLPVLNGEAEHFRALMAPESDPARCAELIETISAALIGELKRQGLTDGDSDFLLDHVPAIFETISDPALKKLHFLAE